MGKTVDFEKARRRRQRIQSLRRISILVGIVALVSGAVYLNNYLVNEGMSTRVSDLVESMGGSGYPVPMPGGVIRDVKTMGKNLAVLNDTNLYVYNAKGKQVANIQRMTDNTVLLTNKDRALTFDVNSKRYAVYSASKQLLSREVEDNIITADLGQGGELAVVTSPRRFVAEVNVYDRQFEWIFRWQSSENQVLDLSIAPKGDRMAVGCASTASGMLQSSLHLFQFNLDQEMAKVLFPDELILHVDFQGEERIAVLTDRQYRIVDFLGNTVASYPLDTSPLLGVERLATTMMLQYDHQENRTQDLVVVGGDCKVEAELTIEGKVRDMAIGSKHIYLLTDHGIDVYSRSFELEESYEIPAVSRIHLIGGTLYYFTREEIRVLGQEDLASDEEESPALNEQEESALQMIEDEGE